MKKKVKRHKKTFKKKDRNNSSIEYTIEELLKLGKQYNRLEIAPPIFSKQSLTNTN